MWLDQYVGPWEVLFDTAQIKNVSWSEVATGGGTFTNGYARFRMYVDATGLGRVVNNWNDVIRTDTTIAPVYLAVGSGRYRLSVSALTENGAPGTQSMIRVGLRHRPGVGSYSLVRTFPFVAYVEPVIKQGAFTEDYIFGDQDYAIKMTRINR
jgi:hypothetical protein